MAQKPLRRTRIDLIATVVIAAIAVICVLIVWATAPIRSSELRSAAEPFVAEPVLATIPDQLSETWRAPDTTPGNSKPAITAGVIIGAEGSTITGYTPAGDILWTYQRDVELCTLSTGFNAAIATYRTGVGCGDVVAINADQGTYKATRSAQASDTVAPIASNDHVGIVGTERVELWRSDLVRTVEYGEVAAKQEAGQQPFPECTITSAMTRKNLLAVTESCPEGETFLRLQETTPEDSREPNVLHSFPLEDPDARLVSIGQEVAAVYQNTPAPTITSFNDDGTTMSSQEVNGGTFGDVPFQPATGDLPHHMSWFDGQRLLLFSPGELNVTQVFDGALGTGIAIDGRLLYPTDQGIAVADWDTGEVIKTILINRSSFEGHISLGIAGNSIVEKRGDEIVILN